ncbi:class I SAM-dependent methyltransferase [Rhodopirellula sp. P2]|uniref:class I SAM-dependent methyltransferase n=1 Tax=Rhodopirellula sp. P2 TaxID=2127060 RepID=UPI003083F548
MLKVAAERVEERGLNNVMLHHADATKFELPENSVDVVTFSYSLTMIPDWFESILIARRILKPGGRIAVTDFHVSRKHAAAGSRQHGWLRRTFWSLWFAADNVSLSSDHLAMLNRQFEMERCEERLGSVPYMPLLKAPYYLFLGGKPAG